MNITINHERNWNIRPARADDAKALIELLGADAPQHVSAHTVWEIPWSWQHYLVACDERGKLVAAGSLQPIAGNRAEIRGLRVAESWRGAKLALAIVERLLERARTRGLEPVCVTREPGFFSRFGFRRTLPTWLDLRRQPVAAMPSAPRIAMELVPEVASC